MIGFDDGTSISDSKNLLLDIAEFFVVGRCLEQLVDRLGYVVLMISGSMGMTRRDFIAQSFFINRLHGPSGKGVPMHVNRQTTSFIDISTEAGILLGGNGAPCAMPVSLTHVCLQLDSVLLVSNPLPSHSSHYPSLWLSARFTHSTTLS